MDANVPKRLEDLGLSPEIHEFFKGLEGKMVLARTAMNPSDEKFRKFSERLTSSIYKKGKEWLASGNYTHESLYDQMEKGIDYLMYVAEREDISK